MKNILVVSHCILNNASKVFQDEADLALEYENRDRFLRLAVEKHIQLLQLPCPEFIVYGSRRWGHVKDQFMHPHFRRESVKMLEPIVDQIEEYDSYREDFNVMGIVSVEGSPSCGARLTCRANWFGEISSVPTAPSMSQEKGAFMEILSQQMALKDLSIPMMTIEEAIGLLETI